MKKFLQLLLLSTVTLVAACSSQPLSETPLAAKIPELEFFYWKNNAWQRVRGHGGDYFNVGDSKKFLVRTNSSGSNCSINYEDGDSQETVNCTGNSTTEIDLGTYYANNPNVVGISVAMENLGSQVGFFYPTMGSAMSAIPLSYKCPYQSVTSNINVCTRPATYPLQFTAQMPSAGTMQFIYQCNGEALVSQNYTVPQAEAVQLQISEANANFCSAAVNFKSSTGGPNAQALLDVRFYDPQYIPLTLPVVTQVQGGWQVCAGEDYAQTGVGLNDEGSLGTNSCMTVQGSTLDFIAWDSIGRTTWVYQTAASAAAKIKSQNNWKFYVDAGPWFKNKTTNCNGDLNCYKTAKTALLKDTKFKAAATKWDATLLYK